MNDIWHFLREFESKDIVKRFYKNKHGLTLNTTKALEITSAFIQGREYFFSYKNADISVQPLLLYYGIVSLSRGLILSLSHNKKENNIEQSHGLSFKNCSDVFTSKKYQDLILKTSSGTFNELIIATGNKTYIRNGTSNISASIRYDLPEKEIEFSLLDISYSFPDLKQSLEAWLNEKASMSLLSNEWIKPVDEKYTYLLQGKHDLSLCEKLFPNSVFSNVEILDKGEFSKITHDNSQLPLIVQKWVNAFQVIGDPFIIPPLSNGIFLNNISLMYAASYVFGMLSRYYPSVWNNINKGIISDGIFPFAINLMSLLEQKYPQVILDFLRSPYDFEKSKD